MLSQKVIKFYNFGRFCSKLEKLCLKLISEELKRTGEETTRLMDILDNINFEAGFGGIFFND